MFKAAYKKITSLQHPLVKYFVDLRERRQQRELSKTALVFGKKVICELCRYLTPKLLMATSETHFKGIDLCENRWLVTCQILKKISNLPSFDDLVAEFPLPNPVSLKGMRYILALDSIADPGNLGTLVRTSVALGFEGIYLLENCCDLFNDKTIRASKGGSFILPFNYGTLDECICFSREEKLDVYIAHLQGEDIKSCHISNNAILLLSNESRGVCEKMKERGKLITIPISEKMESLNVAISGAILMHQLKSF
jgi:RNA methyltransferase, TrmH family